MHPLSLSLAFAPSAVLAVDLSSFFSSAWSSSPQSLLASNSTSSSNSSSSSGTCNGYAAYCSLPYSNVTQVGTHDAYAVSATSPAANQNYTVATQLQNGVRFLQAQGHRGDDGQVHLCHTSCWLLDAGTAQAWLGEVKGFLDGNPDEVVSILWVNSDDLPVSTWAEAYTGSGIDTYAYAPTSNPIAKDSWPTYQELISSGKRLISFMDNGADISSVPYIIDEFTNMWENPYDQTDASFPCTIDRINTAAAPTMYLANHFLDSNVTGIPMPDTAVISTTNSLDNIVADANSCASQHGTYPTFILVDFYSANNGSAMQAAAVLNGVTYVPTMIGNGTSQADKSGARTSSSLSRSAAALALVAGAIGVLA